MEQLAPYWYWIIAAVALAAAEIVAPGFFLVWLGGAALLTGVATAVLGLDPTWQFAVFVAVSVASIALGRHYMQRNPIVSSDPQLNDRAARLVGSVVTAVEPIDASHGRVKVGDGVWNARGVDAAIGERLTVTAVEGTTLVVERR